MMLRHIRLAFISYLFASLACAQVEWAVGTRHLDEARNDLCRGPARQIATLEQAIREFREARKLSGGALPVGGITFCLLPGKHQLFSNIDLTADDGGNPESPVLFLGPADKSAVVSGGRALERPGKVTNPLVLERIPIKSRESVVQFDLHEEGINEFGPLIRRGFGRVISSGQLELFFRGKPMTLARWPNDAYARLQAAPKGSDDARSFLIGGSNIKNLAREPDLLATGYWNYDWADETIPIESVNVQTGSIVLQSSGPRYGIKAGQRVFLQNALSELDSPGEWYLDRASGILYFWPPAPIREGDVEVSVASSLVNMAGTNHVRFYGITFEMARGDALVIKGGTDVVVEHSVIRNVGGRAIVASGSHHKFIDVDIYDTGEGGIYLSGGDRQTLLPAGLSVESSRMRRFNRLSRTYRPAIQLGGVGNKAVGNVISDGTHTAILFSGNEHLIAFNEISRVALETGDVGAVYTGRDWTARGTLIRNNYLHDIHGPGLLGSIGIYLDDQACGIVVQGNLFFRVDQPVFIGGGRDNRIQENVMISSSPAIHVDARGLTWQRAMTEDIHGALRNSLFAVPYNRPPYSDRYRNLASILEDDIGAPKYNVIQDNVIVDSHPVRLTGGADRWIKVDSLMASAEDMFEAGAFALNGQKATDFAFRPSARSSSKEPPRLPLETMECVTRRWQQRDAGKSVMDCRVY